MTNKRPTNTAEAIAAQLNSVRPWDVLSGLLMQEYGLAAMPARIKAAKILKGQSRDAAEIALGNAARTRAESNAR